MSWLWGKKPEEAQMTPHQAQRQKQIESLRQQHRKMIEVTRDASYRIPFNVGAQTFFLDINLTMMFPRDPPTLRLTPKGTHALVDANGTINSPKMATFNMHSDLGRLITEIIEEFQRNPPLMPRDFPPSENGFGPSSSLYPAFSTQPPAALPPRRSDSPATFPFFPPASTQFQPTPTMWCSVSDNFPEVTSMNNAELQTLLDNCNTEDELLWEKISTAPVIASLKDEAKRLTELNRNIAAENMARKPYLEEKKSVLFDGYTTAGELRQQFDDLQRKQETVARRYDPQMIQEQIRIAAAEVEAESDAIAEDFINGKCDLDSFLGKFLEKRKLTHTRKATDDLFGRQVHNFFL